MVKKYKKKYKKKDQPSEKKRELSYEHKAVEMARKHWEEQKKKAINERRTFRGLQIIPTASYYDESQGYKPGEKNWAGFGFDLHPQVSTISGGLILLFIVLTLVFREQSGAFFAFNRGLPLTIRSIFHPILGDKIYGFWGNVIDVLSVLATLFGLATSLGLGIKQVSSGLQYLFGFPTSTEYAPNRF